MKSGAPYHWFKTGIQRRRLQNGEPDPLCHFGITSCSEAARTLAVKNISLPPATLALFRRASVILNSVRPEPLAYMKYP